MAVTERSGLFTYKDANGNSNILYPITKAENVDGLYDNLFIVDYSSISAQELHDAFVSGKVIVMRYQGRDYTLANSSHTSGVRDAYSLYFTCFYNATLYCLRVSYNTYKNSNDVISSTSTYSSATYSPSDHTHTAEELGIETVHSTGTMLASGWTEDGEYSFEADYPSDQYNIEIQPSEDCTIEQYEAWGYAMMLGNSSANTVKALGDVPLVDIPVIIKVVRK